MTFYRFSRMWPNFATQRTLPAWVGLGCLVFGATLAGLVGAQIGHTESELSKIQEELETRRAAAAMLASKAERNTAPQAQKKKPIVSLNDRQAQEDGVQLVRLLNVDWPRRLMEVEKGARGAVQLNSLRIDTAAHSMEIRGEVGALADLDRLRSGWLAAGIPLVLINRHEAIDRDGKVSYEFQASLAWARV